MVKRKLLFLGFALLGIGGFIYYKQAKASNNRITNFIPDNTLVLLETNEISTKKNLVIPRIPLIANAFSEYQILKSIGLSQKDLELLILKKTLYSALLSEGKDQLSFVNYLPLTSDDQDFKDRLDELNHNNTGKRVIPHTTKGFKVLEVIDEKAKPIFAYLIENGYLIFSKSSIALEESILHSENNWIKTLKLHNFNAQSDTIFTRTHINQTAVDIFLKAISVPNSVNFSSIFPKSLDWLNPTSKSIEAVSPNTSSTLFEGQKSLTVQSFNMIPNICSYALFMSFSNREKLTNQLIKNLEKNEKINTIRERVSNKFDVEFDDVYNKINQEISLCSFDNSGQNLQNKILIIKQKGLSNPLKIISSKVAQESKNDVFNVQYGGFSITDLGIREFPMMLFGEIYAGFEECYFTEYKDYIIMASSLRTMQDYLVLVSKGEVWSNSTKINKILSYCLPANLTLIAENAQALKSLQKLLNNQWSEKINSNEKALSGIQAEILQSNSTESRLILVKNSEVVKSKPKNFDKWIKLKGIAVESISKPMYLTNPKNKNPQILVQSADFQLNLFENGKRIWNHPLNGTLVGPLKRIKYAKGASQQLIGVTKSKIFVLTRKDKGFGVLESKPLKGLKLENFNVFENETDENITLVSENGQSYQFNQEKNALTSLKTNPFPGQSLTPMPTIIHKGTEYVVILKKTGKLYLQSAEGKIAPNFPVSIPGTFVSIPLLEGDNSVFIRIISEQGDLYKISLEGKILEKRQLFRPTSEAKFSMAIDENGTDWVLMRTNGKEVVVLDKYQKELLTIKDLNYGKKVLGYYNLGVAGKYFSVHNGFESYRFFNENGEGIGQISIDSKFKPILSYSDSYKKIIMNITSPSHLETWSVKIR